MEIKQHISKWPTGFWRNHKGNQKISRNKWQWKHNSKPMGFSKSSSKRDVYSNTILPTYKKQEKHQVDNLTLHLKQLEKEKQNKQTTTKKKKQS